MMAIFMPLLFLACKIMGIKCKGHIFFFFLFYLFFFVLVPFCYFIFIIAAIRALNIAGVLERK